MSDERPADAPPSDPRPPGDSQTLPAGYRLGRYEIGSVLGLGGFGTTYRAHDTRLHRDVAIKEYLPSGFSVRHPDGTVRPRSAQEAETFEWGRERFADEARTLARLERAAGIVNVHDIVEANGTAYMVMEFLRGETLEALLKRHGTLSQDGIERLLYPLLAGLESVHHADFLHRDIKPANILIDEAGTPKLIDFGASRMAVQGRTQAMTAIFTPGYAAPEQMALSGNQGPWSDIYALGATLHQCVSGVQPPSAIERMIEDRLAPASEIGRGRYAPGLLAAIDAALVLKPAGRPQSIAEWRGLIAGGLRPLAAAAAPVIAPAASTAAGSRWPAWVAAGIVALALAGGGIYAWRTMQDAAAHQLVAEKERAARIAAEAEAAARARAEADKAAAAKAEAERIEAERAAAARRAAVVEREAAERLARERAETERAARVAAEKAAAEARERAARDAASRDEARAQVPTVAGTWTGSYSCLQGATGLTLVVEGRPEALSAVFSFYPLPGGADGLSGRFRMTGAFDPARNVVSLHPARWIDQPPNYVMVGIQARLDAGGRRLDGTITTEGCSWVRLAR